MSKVEEALTLCDEGLPVAAAAKVAGISRSAVYQAMAIRDKRVARNCSECGEPLPDTAKASAMTCSGKCRVARTRRLAKEKSSEAAAAKAAKAAKLAAEIDRIKAASKG